MNAMMPETPSLHGAKVLVTGASGFIGGRLVDYLLNHYHAEVRALVRGFGRAVRLARQPVELFAGDLLDPASVRQAAEGCDYIFHCGAGISGDDDIRRRTTVDGTRNVLEAGATVGVKRIVHVSSVAVHGPDPGPVVDEDSPLVYTDDIYSDAKIDAEKLALEACRANGLPVVILRPTIVYGPRSVAWAIGPLSSMKAGKFTLIGGGRGIANHVFVDDVVQALLLAAVRPEAVGEAFLISSGWTATWKEFYGYYADWLGIEALPDLSVEEIEEQRKSMEQLKQPLYLGLSFVASPRIQTITRQLPAVGGALHLATRAIPASKRQALLEQAASLREVKLNPPKLPKERVVEMFLAQGVCRIDKAQRLLGFQPVFDLPEGMRLTEAWARHNKLV